MNLLMANVRKWRNQETEYCVDTEDNNSYKAKNLKEGLSVWLSGRVLVAHVLGPVT